MINSESFSKILSRKIQDKDILPNIFEKEKIFCIASKDEVDVKTYFFYGQERLTKKIILMEVNLKHGDNLSINAKTEDKQLLKDFLIFLKDVLVKSNY